MSFVIIAMSRKRIIDPRRINIMLRGIAYQSSSIIIFIRSASRIAPICRRIIPRITHHQIYYTLYVNDLCTITIPNPSAVLPNVLGVQYLIIALIIRFRFCAINPFVAGPFRNDYDDFLLSGIERVFLFLCAGKHAGFGSVLLVKNLIACGIVICHNTR